MFWIFCLAVFCLFVASLVMPWLHRAAIRRLEADVARLKARLNITEAAAVLRETPQPTPAPHIHTSVPVFPLPAAETVEDFSFHSDEDRKLDTRYATAKQEGFEARFGARLPVWAGGIALALAGFYLVKYSIDMGWLSPAVRLVIGALFGIGLIGGGGYVRRKAVADGTRIAQALTGAGLAVLYGCIFAATSYYHFLSPALGFAGMAVVTALAIILSLRHGAPVAMLGLAGGFLTPALVGSDQPSAVMLFAYLYFVLAGLLVVTRRQGWWSMAFLAVLAVFAWVAFWLLSGAFVAADAVWAGVFLLAIAATVAGVSGGAADTRVPMLNQFALGGAAAFMAFTAARAQFSPEMWGLFGLLSAGGMALAFFRPALYAFFPWATLIASGVMLIAWKTVSLPVLAAFAALYITGGAILQWRGRAPLHGLGIASAAGLGFYALGYLKLHAAFPDPHAWGALALAGAGLAVLNLRKVMAAFTGYPQKEHLIALGAATATAFISLGAAVVLESSMLPLALSAEVAALAWIGTRVGLPVLRRIAAVLAVVFGGLMTAYMIFLAEIVMYTLFEEKLYGGMVISGMKHALLHLALPAAFFAAAAVLFRRGGDDRIVRAFEYVAVLLLTLAGYYIIRNLMHPGDVNFLVKAGFIERGFVTSLIFAAALAALYAGRRFARQTLRVSGLILASVAVFRLGWFDYFIHNPLWDKGQNVGALPVLNGLLLTYGLPVLWLAALVQFLSPPWARRAHGFMLVLAFTLASFEVRQFFHGAFLDVGRTGNAEIYAYSAVWLLFALGLLFAGTLRRNRALRVAALAVMILTAGKVFLFDAAALTGLYRVFSFLGLGLSLLGLSWFYARFIQTKEGE